MRFIVCLALSFAVVGFAMDNYSTWLALSSWEGQVYESNPIARLGIEIGGAAPSLIVNFLLGTALCTWLARARFGTDTTKVLMLFLVGVLRWTAGLNNFAIIYYMNFMYGG